LCTKELCAAFQSLNVTKEKLQKALLYKKFAHNMLMKLTVGSHVETATEHFTDLVELNFPMVVWF